VEVGDLVYLLIKKTFNGVSFGKTLNVAYIYDQRSVDTRVADWILVYEISSGGAFADVGGEEYLGRGRVTIDVRTNSKTRYGKIRNHIKESLKSQTKKFEVVTPTAIDTVFSSAEELGAYVQLVTVTDATGLSEGDYISWDAGSKKGWIYFIDGLSLYVFTYPRTCYAAFIVPSVITELSDKIKKLYRFTMDIGVWLYEEL
jgi:hypothetical protein